MGVRGTGTYFEDACDPSEMLHANAPMGDVKLLLRSDHGEAHASGQAAVYVLEAYADETGPPSRKTTPAA